MRAILRCVCLGATLFVSVAGCSSSRDSAEGVPHVDGARAHELVAAGATLLDVRSPQEFDVRHATGAVNIPVDEIDAHLSEVPRDKPVVTYCAVGVRSAAAAAKLKAAGYQVYDLGTLATWGDPVSR